MPKISQLESAVDITASDLIQIIDVEDDSMAPSGTNKKITASVLANHLFDLMGYPLPPQSGTRVLGCINGQIQWLATEDC